MGIAVVPLSVASLSLGVASTSTARTLVTFPLLCTGHGPSSSLGQSPPMCSHRTASVHSGQEAASRLGANARHASSDIGTVAAAHFAARSAGSMQQLSRAVGPLALVVVNADPLAPAPVIGEGPLAPILLVGEGPLGSARDVGRPLGPLGMRVEGVKNT